MSKKLPGDVGQLVSRRRPYYRTSVLEDTLKCKFIMQNCRSGLCSCCRSLPGPDGVKQRRAVSVCCPPRPLICYI